MNNQTLFSLIAVFIVACASILIIASEFSPPKNKTDREKVTVGYQYIVKEYNGKIAIFDYETAVPVEILDCPLSSLPADEAEKLKSGINVATEAELQQLIEAFD